MNRHTRHTPNLRERWNRTLGVNQDEINRGFASRMRAPVIEEVVEFNPAWLNEQGLMTNVPGPRFLSHIEFKRPYSFDTERRAIGFYVADRSKDLLNGVTNPSPSAQGDLLLKFSISDHSIHQELSAGRKALIRSDYSVRIIDARTDRLSEIWEGHRRMINPINPAEGFAMEWARTSHMATVQDKPLSTLMPGWYGDLFCRLTMVFERFLRDIGYTDQLDAELENGDDDPFYWVYELTQQDSDARFGNNEGRTTPASWVHLLTDYPAYQLWGNVLTAVNSWRFQLDSGRVETRHARHQEFFANIRAYIEAAVQLRDDAFQREEARIAASFHDRKS